MSYLEEFKKQIHNRNFTKFLQLWEEYCHGDSIDTPEFMQFLALVKNSDFAKSFGQLIETALPLLELVEDKKDRYEVLRLLIDLETTNTPLLADLATEALKEKYETEADFQERLRLIGLRSRENFQGAVSNYDLLAHMKKGKFVFHAGGWGTGEIVDISPLRQQVTVEFENLSGRKQLTFDNAFKALVPLVDEHFLARRFADADQLEKEAKEDPIAVVKMLLKDLGPKSASEIKDELCELVIPEADWVKWWQGARAKLKKDPIIEPPENLKDSFRIRATEVSQEERLHKAVQEDAGVDDLIQTSYNFIRDLPINKKNDELSLSVKEKLFVQLKKSDLSLSQRIQLLLLLEGHFNHQMNEENAVELIKNSQDLDNLVNGIEIIALKKRALIIIREQRSDWVEVFLQFLVTIKQSVLRDYVLKELNHNAKPLLEKKLKAFLNHPEEAPETFVWYFQKIMQQKESKEASDLPFANKEGQFLIFEAFLILYSRIEPKPEYRELLKKMYTQLSGKRYAIVRDILEGSSIEFAKEFLLLVSKCPTLSDHDNKILHSLTEVVHPSLAKKTNSNRVHQLDNNIIWTSEEGYFKTQDQIRHIGTVEVVENAREIEAARALGDLRENSEYKFALEKRSRLQGQLKTLSDQLSRARIITKDDIHPDEVSVGSIVEAVDGRGQKSVYTILGPWDANIDLNVLSFQSKLAQSMVGSRIGDKFSYREEEHTITDIKSYLEK